MYLAKGKWSLTHVMRLHMHTLLICLFLMFTEPSLYKIAALQGNPTDSGTRVAINVRQAGNENVGKISCFTLKYPAMLDLGQLENYPLQLSLKTQ